MSDTIVLYENGKAVGGEGHPTNADEITFDNSNTNLVSENTEDAIKEVNAKFDKGSVSVTADGVKTLGTLLAELGALIDYTKITNGAIVDKYGSIMQVTSHTATKASFAWSMVTAHTFVEQINLSSITADNSALLSNDGVIASENNAVITSGVTITLYY